jgi:hypothetical protein
MVRKVKKNLFKLGKQDNRQDKRQFTLEDIRVQRMEARAEMLTEFTLMLAWTLRANYGYGKKRIEQVITDVFDTMSDSKMSEYGQELFSLKDINPQLIEEVDIDMKKLIDRLALKHFNRVKDIDKTR